MKSGMMVYNTMHMKKERFVPIRPGEVRMFVCGPTVQNLIHIGHARTYVFYDVVARYLSKVGYKVSYLMNITDVDDRITEDAKKRGVDSMELARQYTKAFVEDIGRLRIETISRIEPVSRYVQTMIEHVSRLLETKHAYIADGVVYFDTSTYRRYGKLSHQSQAELSLRPLELSPNKRNLLDFALWRPITLVEGKWDSPWGRGSPGWHIEDTAVTLTNFGPQYDIHGGAYELIYPHHEAEIAQAESITGVAPLVKYWAHTGLVNTHGRKMSKSAGNMYTVRDILRRYGPDELRLYLLSWHYRKDVEFEERQLERRKQVHDRISKRVRELARTMDGRPRQDELQGTMRPFFRAMDDDFDTPEAVWWLEQTGESLSDTVGPNKRRLSYWALVDASQILGVNFLGGHRRQ